MTVPPPKPKFIPDRYRFALCGALLGLGSPLGFLLLRMAWVRRALLIGWVRGELAHHAVFYIYTAVGTVLAMGALGFFLGRRLDSQSSRVNTLEKISARLRVLSVTDGLTGVYIRRHLMEKLEEELRRAERYKHSIASLFVDVDNFKSCNEIHGHVFGDEILRKVAEAIRNGVRDTDIVGRYGGDEFLVLLPHARARDAFVAAERIRKGVESLSLSRKGVPVPVTVSVGVLAAVPSQMGALDYLEMADQALRRSKGLGKNCTILCDVPKTVSVENGEGVDPAGPGHV